jgi:acetyltransferase
LEQLLVRFSQLVAEQRWIKEIDINPLLVSEDRLVGLDARVILHPADVTGDQLPRLAIRPYPVQYQSPWTLRDGTPVMIRPIRPDDEPLIIKFHEPLSERSIYYYFFSPMKLSQRIAHERLTRICFLDYDRQISLVTDHKDPNTGEHKILGVGRLIKQHGRSDAEFAMIVADAHQNQGMGQTTQPANNISIIAEGKRLRRRLSKSFHRDSPESVFFCLRPSNPDVLGNIHPNNCQSPRIHRCRRLTSPA